MRTRSLRRTILLACFLMLLGLPAHAEQETLTNDSVIALVEAGFSEGIIIEKIRTSPRDFKTAIADLTALKKAGVSETIIQVMINPDTKLADSATAAPAGGLGFPGAPAPRGPAGCEVSQAGNPLWLEGGSPAMWYSESAEGNRLEMEYERGTLDRVGFAVFMATLLELQPLHAPLRLAGNPVFWSCINPTDMPLVKFTEDDEEDERNTSLGRTGPFSHETKISSEDLVPISYEKSPQGLWRITPKQPLKRGEYGFVPQGGGNFFKTGERVFTFGVD